MQLFARLGSKKRLGTLGLPLFNSLPSPGGGLCPGDLVEVTGGEGSGKTEILLNIVTQCVLPRMWCGREVGGREVEVVWVSTDHKLDLLRLVAILEGGVCRSHPNTHDGRRGATDRQLCSVYPNTAVYGPPLRTRESVSEKDSEHEALIMSCLSRVHVVHCSSGTELGLALQSLRLSFLGAHPDVCALFLDNVAEFHWLDRAEAAGSLHGALVKQSTWVNALSLLMKEYHLVTFAARLILFSQSPAPGQRVRQVFYSSWAHVLYKLSGVCFSVQHYGRGSYSDDLVCQEWRKMLKYRYLLTAAETTESSLLHYTARRILPPCDKLYNFVVSASGVIFW